MAGPIKVRALRAGYFALNWAAKDLRSREVAKGQVFLVPEERFVSKLWMERVEELAPAAPPAPPAKPPGPSK